MHVQEQAFRGSSCAAPPYADREQYSSASGVSNRPVRYACDGENVRINSAQSVLPAARWNDRASKRGGGGGDGVHHQLMHAGASIMSRRDSRTTNGWGCSRSKTNLLEKRADEDVKCLPATFTTTFSSGAAAVSPDVSPSRAMSSSSRMLNVRTAILDETGAPSRADPLDAGATGTRAPRKWREFWDEEMEAWYYFNVSTLEAQWVRPDEY